MNRTMHPACEADIFFWMTVCILIQLPRIGGNWIALW
jgi:hypothetical protein